MMHPFKIALFIGVALLGLQADVRAQLPKQDIPAPARGYDWREPAKKRLDAKEIEQLAKDKILVTNEAYKQVFAPYLAEDLPLFITSDSLLNGFHVLYEESILRLEQANARKLGGILKFLWTRLQTVDKQFTGKPQLVAAAGRRAKIVVAIAMQLLGEETTPLEPAMAALVKEEVKRIEAAQGQGKPAWLGPPDRAFVAVEYTRYRPRGFYTRNLSLQRYFRTVSWLQSIPFRVSSDEELVSFLMLQDCVTYNRAPQDGTRLEAIREFLEMFDAFVGPGDDWSLTSHIYSYRSETRLDDEGKGLGEVRKELLERAKKDGEGPMINDQRAYPADDPTLADGLAFRILSACRTPDAVLFQRTTDPKKFHRDFPNGLEVCAALGSSFAGSRLSGKEQRQLLAEIDRCKHLFRNGETLYTLYLTCLAALLDKPEPDAPPFMSAEPWQIKSCQTVLGGWSQMRHTWALQAKRNQTLLGGGETTSGFLEPVPEFYARMTYLVELTESGLKQAGALATDPKALAPDLRAGVVLLEKDWKVRKDPIARKRQYRNYSPQELTLLEMAWELMLSFPVGDGKRFDIGSDEGFARLTAEMRRLADEAERGHLPDDPSLARCFRDWNTDIGDLWRSLGMICRRLESLAHKQLRGVAFSEEENRFIRSYGERLAKIMLYGGNSYYHPHDDAPRVVDVFGNPNANRKYLEVGIARPRALYVLYPVNGGEVLCRGAVMPYYEFAHDSRLTDAEWKTLLDSDKRPKTPDWIGPIVAPGGLCVPKPKD